MQTIEQLLHKQERDRIEKVGETWELSGSWGNYQDQRNWWAPLFTSPMQLDTRQELYPDSLADLNGCYSISSAIPPQTRSSKNRRTPPPGDWSSRYGRVLWMYAGALLAGKSTELAKHWGTHMQGCPQRSKQGAVLHPSTGPGEGVELAKCECSHMQGCPKQCRGSRALPCMHTEQPATDQLSQQIIFFVCLQYVWSNYE